VDEGSGLMEIEGFSDFLKRIREEKRKGTKTGYADFEWDGYTSARAETATKTAQFKSFEEFLRSNIAGDFSKAAEDNFFKHFVSGIGLNSDKPDVDAKKQEKIKKLEAFINDAAATSGEKENAKRLIEKIKAGE
jgi:hypothetical protein